MLNHLDICDKSLIQIILDIENLALSKLWAMCHVSCIACHFNRSRDDIYMYMHKLIYWYSSFLVKSKFPSVLPSIKLSSYCTIGKVYCKHDNVVLIR